MPDYSVIVSRRAAENIRAHAAFLARVSPDAAKAFSEDFKAAASSLESFPERCPVFNHEGIERGKYRFLVFKKRYLLLFVIDSSTVYIDCILDCRQDYGWLI